MEILGLAPELFLLFVGFGAMVGVIFGFFGIGSFLITPALLVMGYDSKVVVGTGMAFVFGTAVIGTLRHRDIGQVDYRLGAVVIVWTTVGIEIGKRLVLYLRDLGVADLVVGTTYVALLATVGGLITLEATGNGPGELFGVDLDSLDLFDAASLGLPPRLSVKAGGHVSFWFVSMVTLAAGILAGFLGIGGGFLRLPALTYLFGIPLPVAVGTNLFGVTFSGAFGSYLWATAGGVDLSIVVPLLAGSAFGARVGSATTRLVDNDEMKLTFGLLLIAGSIAVALRQVGDYFGVATLQELSFGLLVVAAFLVSGAVLYSGITTLRQSGTDRPTGAD